jgi:chorismate dehydratase
MILRLSAVSYLNTKPLVVGLEDRQDLFAVRFDLPSKCAELLHAGEVDLGIIPAIEYQRADADYWIVPDLAIGSDGPVASVAVFSRVPVERIRSIALDTSSRTSVALTQILCARHWDVAPTFTSAAPDLEAMLATADAALLIGDLALAVDAGAENVLKLDLGLEWRAMTGLPFVYAMWAGREGVASPAHVAALQAARDRGMASLERIAEQEAHGDPVRARAVLQYLRDNLRHHLGEAEIAGLQRFHALAADLGLVPTRQPLRFYGQVPGVGR